MTQQRLVLIVSDRLTAYHWHSGWLECEAGFCPDPPGLRSFAEYLGQHRGSIFRILVLLAEEGFHREDVPYVRGSDRQALLERKLNQHFYGARLMLALSLGRETAGRRDERILLTALNRPLQLDPWLALMSDAEARIAGLYTLPLLAGTLAENTSRAAPLFLLLTLSTGGIHQIVFENARLRFSRLTPLLTDNPEEWADACAAESGRIYQYLVAQRVITHGTALTTVVLAHPGQIGEFRSRCKDSGEIHFVFADLLAESERQGLRNQLRDSRSDALFLHLMVRKPPQGQFADAALRRCHGLSRIRLALRHTGIAVLLGGMLIAGKEGHEYYALREEARQTDLQTELERREYQAALRDFPAPPMAIARLRALVRRYGQLEQRSATLEPMFQRISRALDLSPRVTIDRIEWRGHDSPEAAKAGAVSADIHARLPLALLRDRKEQLQAIDRFSNELASDPGVAVLRLRMPFDVDSGKSLKSGDIEASGFDAPEFALRIVERR